MEPARRRPSLLVTERRATVTVIRLLEPGLAEDQAVAGLVRDLGQLLEREGQRQVVLNCAAVEDFASDLLAKLVWLRRKLVGQGGQLALCELPSPLADALQRTRLSTFFDIYPDEVEAMRALTA
jgi:anti-anti-sigma factor